MNAPKRSSKKSPVTKKRTVAKKPAATAKRTAAAPAATSEPKYARPKCLALKIGSRACACGRPNCHPSDIRAAE